METCAICGCKLVYLKNAYGKSTVEGRSHASRHHYVAERFFGRSKNRPSVIKDAIFDQCPWGLEGKEAVFCYDCHEELLHNPVLLPEDIANFRLLVERSGCSELEKTDSREELGQRIRLLHEAIAVGLKYLLNE